MFCATFHHTNSRSRFLFKINYYELKKHYRITVDEIGNKPLDKWLPFSRLKPYLTKKVMKSNDNMLRVAPDLEIYLNCFNRHAKIN